MSEDGKKNCSSCGKCRCKCIYAILHLLILTCIATALWQISGQGG